MKNFFTINKSLVTITILLYPTIYFGIIFQIVLGVTQLCISVCILSKFNSLKNNIKILFLVYLALTVSSICFILITYFWLSNDIVYLIYFTAITLLLGLFHLYITYKIKNYENSNT